MPCLADAALAFSVPIQAARCGSAVDEDEVQDRTAWKVFVGDAVLKARAARDRRALGDDEHYP